MKKILFFMAICLVSCAPNKVSVDLIVVNANVYTVNDAFAKASAFAVKDGKFVAVGTTDEINEKYTSLKTINAGGKTITPGLIDAHCHFYGLGLNQQIVDLVGTKSYQEVLDRVQEFQAKNPMEFIRGRGWDQNDWEVKEFPTKMELDALFPNTPVALERVDGHAYLVNQKALDMAGITAKT
jgi:predicted amidohydrolase YtcJ